ncbi:MAG: hypothetical protein LBU41_02050, partial [Clostridiales Family XIII bacterium]|nr:hypothetical protein [Clostridiales Family XIII bacterium]
AIRPDNLVFLATGDQVQLDRDISVSILYPPRADETTYRKMTQASEDENRTSLLMLVDYEGVTTLMTGDIGEAGERAVLEAGKNTLQADILKVGHHGSKSSSSEAFLDAVGADFAVIQCGRNTFGHPTGEVIEKLHAHDIIVLRNDLYGAVRFKIDKGKIVGISETTSRIPADRTGFT